MCGGEWHDACNRQHGAKMLTLSQFRLSQVRLSSVYSSVSGRERGKAIQATLTIMEPDEEDGSKAKEMARESIFGCVEFRKRRIF